MKAKRFRLLTVLLAAVMMVALSVSVMAAKSNAVTQDGLTAQLFTDKDSYKAGESVQASVQVDNHTGRDVFVFTQLNVPESVKLAGDTTAFDTRLQDGETWTTPGGVTLSAADIVAGSSTSTGDNMQAGFWIVLTVLAVCGIIALFVYGKNKKTWLSIMLCMAMVAGMVVAAVPAQAADVNGDMELSCTIQVDGRDAEVSATVSYVIYDEAEEEAEESAATLTEAPTETAAPEVTEAPAETEAPEATEAPADSDSDTDSDTTLTPAPTTKPIQTSTLWYDSVMFMTAEEQAEVDAIMSGVLAMHKGSFKAYYDNEKLDMPVAPVEIDMEMYVPLQFTAETLGAGYAWDASVNTVTLTAAGQATTLSVGDDVQLVDGVLYIAPAKMAEILNTPYFVHYGLVVFGKDSTSFDAASARVQNEVLSMVRYIRPAGQQLYEDLTANFEEGEHPRIHATADDFTRIRGLVEADPFMEKCFANLQNRADKLLETKPVEYDMNPGSQSLNNIDDSAERIELLAMVYQITEDTKYADRAWKEMETLCNYPDWNPYHFLDIGKIMSGLAVGFDWLYDYMSESQREFVKNAMLEKGLQECYWAYIGTPSEAGDHSDTWWIYREYNWSANINDAVLLALVAICDEEFEGNELEEMLIPSFELALRSLEIHFNEWDPDGGWEEGPGYCADTLIFDAEILSLLETAMGTDYGIAAATNITAGAYYMLYQHAPAGDFNYGDAIEKTATDYDYEFYLARVYRDKSLGYERKSALEAGNTYECMPFELIWYDPQWVGDKIEGLNLDKYFREIELVTMRSDWNEDGIFAGFLSGNNNLTHSHLDTGTFILDWAGTRWATELGKDQASYESGGKNYVVYRKRAEGQNTLVIDDLPYTNASGTRGDDQLREEGCVITRYESKKQGALAVTDMRKAYETWATSAERGVMLTDNRGAFVVRDEVTLKSKADIYWFAHTKLENTIAVSDDKKSAIMTDPNGNRMWVGIISEEGTFEVRDCTPLPGSPNPTQADNSATFHKLTIKFEGVTEMSATVAYIPLPRDTSVTEPDNLAKVKALCAGNIADWQIPDGEIPSVDSLTVGGVEIEGFEPTKTSYTVTIRNDQFVDGNIPPVVATKDGVELTVTQATIDKPTASFVVTEGDASAQVTINFIVKYIVGKEVEGYYITEDDITVSSIPQPDIAHPRMVLDGDLTTRWSSQNPGNYIILDFGQVRSFTKLALAMNNQSITRTYQLEILVSADDDKEDDSKYISVYKGSDLDAFDADGNQLGTVNYYFGGEYQARYIKIMLNGWNPPGTAQNWNNVAEIGGVGIDPLPPAPEIIETVDSYSLGSETAVTIKATGEFEKLADVKMNGETVDASNYSKTASEDGTTIITFNQEYLETLPEGKHTVTILYNDQTYVKTALTVVDTRPVTIVLKKYGVTEDANAISGTNTVAIEAEAVIQDGTGMEVKQGEPDVNGASASSNKIANAKTTQITSGVPETLEATMDPALGFEITPDKNKTYYVWARVYRSADKATSARYMYVSLAGEDYSVKNIQNDVTLKTYTWIPLGSVAGKADESVNVRFVTRQGGLWFDKFLVTTDGTLTGTEDVFKVESVATPEIVTDGTVSEYTIASNAPVTITTTGEAEKVAGVKVGDAVVDASNYTVAGTDNTIVTFTNTYLDSLSTGVHKITISYSDGSSAETTLTIKAKPVVLTKYSTTNGTVAIEAEDVIVDNTLITVKSDGDAANGSGEKVASIEKRGDITDKSSTAAPAMGFEITPDKAGTYNIWVRVYRNVAADDAAEKATAAYMSLAEQDYTTLSFKEDSVKTYYWKNLGSVVVEEKSVAQSVSVRFKTHSNSLWFDKFIVTTSTDTPTGAGDNFATEPVLTPEIVTDGTVSEYTIGSQIEVTIKTTGEAEKLASVKVGDTVVDASNYTVAGTDSTIVTFTNGYLDTLTAGAYSVTISYNDGNSVETTLTIIEKVATITLKKYGDTEGTTKVTGTGTVAIEAEDVIMDSSANIEVAEGVTDGNGAVASQGKVAKIKNNVTEGASTEAEMGFDIIPDQNGSYYIWARLYRKDGRAEKAYAVQLSVNDAAYGLWNFKNTSEPQKYTWICMQKVEVDVAVDNKISVCFIPRFKDLWFDKFIVTTDDTFTPTGIGDVSSDTE